MCDVSQLNMFKCCIECIYQVRGRSILVSESCWELFALNFMERFCLYFSRFSNIGFVISAASTK